MKVTFARRAGASLRAAQGGLNTTVLGEITSRRPLGRAWRKNLVQPELKPTPLKALGNNLFAKLEGQQEGGSIKDRAVTTCVYGMLKNGLLKPGGTLALCTSGSAGVSLLRAQRLLEAEGIEINVKIFMPENYVPKPVPQVIANTEGVVTERENPEMPMSRSLCPFDGDFLSSLAFMKQLAQEHDWAILDQHYDVNSMMAHESTANEILSQCPNVTDVVTTTGTGGTAAGLREFLPNHITVHARPAVSGTLDGCTDVRRYNNFCNPELLQGYTEEFFCPEEAKEHAVELEQKFQVAAGPSSGATYSLAKKILAQKPEAVIAFICADGKLGPATATLESGMKGVVARRGLQVE